MKKYIYISLIGLSLFSCRLDSNIDPNNPAEEQISARQRLVAAQTGTYSVQASTMNALGNIWMNSWSGNIYHFGNPATAEQNLNLTSSFYQGIWNGLYMNVNRLQAIIDSPNSKELPYHTAIAKILKAYYLQYIVDLYGDAPYSEAFNGLNNTAPSYDQDYNIYKGLVGELNHAIQLIDSSTATETNAVNGSEDVMLGGNMNNWKKFANTILLKYAVRLSNTTNAEGIALRNQIVNQISGADFISSDVKIQPGYNSSSAESQNPLYNAFGIRTNTGTVNTNGWRLYRASEHMIETLKGSSGKITAGVFDNRIGFIFRKGNAGQYVGVPQGGTKDLNITSDSYFSSFGGIFMKNANEGSAVDGVVMMLAEAEFLQAEAAVHYPGKFSNGQSHFENGINASFNFAGMGSDAAPYIAAISSKQNVGWAASTNKIAAIQYQRWVTLANYNALETFINYRKTGYPETPLSLSTNKPNKPYRLMYPATEYTANASNVPQMTANDCFVINELTPFWYK